MTKIVPDDVLDAALDRIALADRGYICAGAPATYTAATTTNALADVTHTAGDFVKSNGDTSGRKVRVAAKTAIPIDSSGTADHYALVNVAGTRLVYVTELTTSQAVIAGNTADLAAWDVEIADPT